MNYMRSDIGTLHTFIFYMQLDNSRVLQNLDIISIFFIFSIHCPEDYVLLL